MAADEAYPKAEAAAERAIALDGQLAEAYAALGFTKFYGSHQFARSRELLEKAIALDPNSAQTQHWYALTLMHSGDVRIPLQAITRAQELDPHSRAILANKALILFHGGQIADARQILEQLEDSDPDFLASHAYLATLYLSQHRYDDFLREYRQEARLSDDKAHLSIADAAQAGLARGGEAGLLTAMLTEQERRFAADEEPAFKLAQTYALVGDRDRAIATLQKSLDRGESDILGIWIEPALKGLRGDPRYRAIVSKVGLEPFG